MRYALSALPVAATAALLLAGCAGQGAVPAAGSYAQPAAVVDAKKAANPCTATQTAWIFGGECGTVTLATTGGKGSLPAFLKITVSAVFSSGTQKNGTVLVVRDAGPSNIKGTIAGQAFPQWTVYGGGLKLKPYLYLKATNLGGAFSFNKTPQVELTSTTLPKTKCFLEKMVAPAAGKKWAWNGSGFVPGYVHGTTLEFLPFPQGQALSAGGTIYLAISCEE